MGLTSGCPKTAPSCFRVLSFPSVGIMFVLGIVKRRLADQSHISMPQFSHHVGLSQERIKTIPNGLIIIQKINLWAIIPFIFNKRQKALK
ncbi:Uncharacterised protein [Salmonella enterica subsp. enterica]|uniref:Uncharacterized protein n=1 Tax=Salmonella enterica I TaxID=59201 RepID=A0A379WF67_SALET|nr:Uncharacterised protein [Salmonella enterica subsp. enterica]